MEKKQTVVASDALTKDQIRGTGGKIPCRY